jgi:uracil-DNA glycosylase
LKPLEILNQQIVACRQCPRLVEYREEVGRVKRRAYRDQDYWAKPVPGFGDPQARMLLIGLAPAAHAGPYLEKELELLHNLKAVVALGRLAFDVYLAILRDQGKIARRSDFVFGHNKVHRTGPGQPVLISSFHPSQQNTSTGKLTDTMLRAVFLRARRLLIRAF